MFWLKVLYVDSLKQKLILTHKKSLLDSQFDPITSYADCRVGQIAEGCIVSIKPVGAVVVFYNNVKVWSIHFVTSVALVAYIRWCSLDTVSVYNAKCLLLPLDSFFQ
jgi:hypothetical protein